MIWPIVLTGNDARDLFEMRDRLGRRVEAGDFVLAPPGYTAMVHQGKRDPFVVASNNTSIQGESLAVIGPSLQDDSDNMDGLKIFLPDHQGEAIEAVRITKRLPSVAIGEVVARSVAHADHLSQQAAVARTLRQQESCP